MYLVSLFLVAAQLAVTGWMGREIYRNYARYGRADHGSASRLGAAAIVLLVTAPQIVKVTNDPSLSARVVLGLGVICSTVAVVALLRMRSRAH